MQCVFCCTTNLMATELEACSRQLRIDDVINAAGGLCQLKLSRVDRSTLTKYQPKT